MYLVIRLSNDFEKVSALLSALAKFDTPTICNVIELFDVRPRNRGYMNHRVKCCFPELPPMVGYAATAAFRSDAPPAGVAQPIGRAAVGGP